MIHVTKYIKCSITHNIPIYIYYISVAGTQQIDRFLLCSSVHKCFKKTVFVKIYVFNEEFDYICSCFDTKLVLKD